MEEEKAQKLVDTLSKLRKSAGLGVSTHFNFGGASELIQFSKDKDGNLYRDDGLPVNGLYSGFVREGTYNPETSAQLKYGDGRKIKRNFDDIDDKSHDSKRSKKSKDNESKKSKKSKEARKAEKKAAKLEAKKAAKKAEKLELKKKQKLEAKLLGTKASVGSILPESNGTAKTDEEESTTSISKKSKLKKDKKKDKKNTKVENKARISIEVKNDKKQEKEKKSKKSKKEKKSKL